MSQSIGGPNLSLGLDLLRVDRRSTLTIDFFAKQIINFCQVDPCGGNDAHLDFKYDLQYTKKIIMSDISLYPSCLTICKILQYHTHLYFHEPDYLYHV